MFDALRTRWANLMSVRDNPFPLLTEAASTGGPTFVPIGPMRVVVLGDPASIHAMLREHPDAFDKSTRVQRLAHRVLGDSVPMSSGEAWRIRRRAVHPPLGRAAMERYRPTKVAFAERLAASWADGETLDLQHVFTRFTTELTCTTLFSDALEGHIDAVGEALEEAMAAFHVLMSNPVPLDWLPFGPGARCRAARTRLEALVDGILERRPDGSDDLVTALQQAGLDHDAIRGEVLSMMVVGMETTALSLMWTLHYLALNPDVQDRVRVELGSDARDLTRAVYLEALRLRPPAWMIARQCVSDTVLSGVEIPAGSPVFACIYAMHRRAEHYAEPERFDPERWTDDRVDRDAFAPFGSGQRRCTGEFFALQEAEVVLESVLSRWRLETDDTAPVAPRPLYGLTPAAPVRVRVRAVC